MGTFAELSDKSLSENILPISEIAGAILGTGQQ
jgi:hypothetical protein